MDLSGVIFVALALAWAVYLIPKVLRHHDEVAKNRSVDQFSESMRVLARREPVTGRTSRLVRNDVPLTPPSYREIRARRLAARAAARRRRIILSALLVATFVVTGLGLVGALPQWAPLVPGGTVVAFLLLSISLGRRERLEWSLRLAMSGAASDAEPGGPRSMTIPRPAAVHDDLGFEQVQATDETITFDRAELEEALAGQGLWDPLPVTLPTYVTKPKATRAVRQIDLSAPDTHSSGRDEADSALVAQADAVVEDDADDIEDQRAVGS